MRAGKAKAAAGGECLVKAGRSTGRSTRALNRCPSREERILAQRGLRGWSEERGLPGSRRAGSARCSAARR